MGNLVLQTRGNPGLPMLEIPDRYLLGTSERSCPQWLGEFEKIVRAVQIHRQVMLIGKPDPFEFLGSYLAALPSEQRMQYSFASGLSIQEDRPFNLQFFTESTPMLERQFASLQLRTINLNQELFTVPVPSF
jgi:hypothetical protein